MSDKKPKANIVLHFSKGSYLPGEFIKGNIEISTNITTTIQGILIEIFQIEDWKNGNEDKNFIKRKIVSFNLNLKNNKNLKFIDNNIIFPEGITFLPFNFRFSENTCPCFEHPHPEYRSFIRYSFCASILSSTINGTINYPLCLLSRTVIDPDHDPEKEFSDSINQHIIKWKIFDVGRTMLKASIPQDNFKYDSTCKLSIVIDNTYGKMATKEYKVGLRRILYFKDKKGDVKCRYKKQMVRQKVPAVVGAGQKKDYTFDLILKETDLNTKYNYNLTLNPYNIPIEKINYFMPSVNGNIIKCEYNIKVSVYYESFVDKSHRPRVRLPLYIVHQLPNDNLLEPQDSVEFKNKYNLNKNNNKSMNINKTNNNKSNSNNISKSYNNNINNNINNEIIYNNNSENKNLNYSVNNNYAGGNQSMYLNNNYNNNINSNINENNFGERESVALPTLEAIEEASQMKKLEEQKQKEEMDKKILEEENRILNNIKNNSQNNINNTGDTEPENYNIISGNNNNNFNSENNNDFYDKLANEDEEQEKIEVNPRYSSLAAPLAFGAEDTKGDKNKNNENNSNLYPVFEDDEYKNYEYQKPINIYDNENDI